MPNWCENNIEISGPADKLALFVSKIKEGDGLLSAHYPMPESKVQQLNESEDCFLHEIRRSIGTDKEPTLDKAWYYWKVHNWGTKWDIPNEDLSYCDLTPEDKTWTVSFMSAWSPPVAWLHKVSEDNPDLEFCLEFVEYGCWFAGAMTWKDGGMHDCKEGKPDEFDFCAERVDYLEQMEDDNE